MSFINKIKVSNDYYSIAIPYAVCETPAATTAKTATCSNFAVSEGTQIKVKFTYANTAADPTLNVNSTGAAPIKVYGTTAVTTNWKAGSVVEFTYDGTNWIITGFGALQEGTCTVSGGGLSKGAASGGGLSKATASGGALTKGTASGGELSLGTATAPTLDIFEVASASQDTNVTLAQVDIGDKDTTNYPYYFKVGASSTGGGNTVNRAAFSQTVNLSAFSQTVNRAAFSQTVNRAAITDAHTEGYIPAQAATTVISADSSTVSLGAGSETVSLAAASRTVSLEADSTTATAANGSKTEYVKLKKGAITASGSFSVSGSGNVNPGTVSIANQASASVSGKTQITAAPTTDTSQISTYYMAVKATAAANNSQSVAVSGSGTGTASVSTEGYIKTDVTGTGTISASGNATVNVNSKDSSVTYIPLATGSCTVAGGGLSQGTASGGGLSGGGLSGGGLTKGAGSVSVTPTNIALTEVAEAPSSGYYITATGSGTVNRAAVTRAKITRAAFSQVVNRAAVTDTHTAGYIPAKSATTVISADSSTVSLAEGSIAADSTTIGATSLASNTATKYYTVKSGVLSNSAASGVDYGQGLDGPSLNEQDYLYINAGYYPNCKISLATLIPDDPGYDNAGNSHILKNYEAYDTTGKKLLGTIENVSWSADYYTTDETGYGVISNALYTGDSTHYIKAGSVSSSVSGTNPSATGKLTVSGTKANYGFTTTKPSGTDGTNYLTLTPGATAGSAKTFTANMTLIAGWVAAKGTEGTKSVSASVSNGTLEYIPIVTPAFDGGGLTGDDISGTQTKGSVTIAESGTFFSSTGYGITTTKPSGTDGTNYLTVHETHSTGSGSVTGSTTITRAAVLYNGTKQGLVNIADNTQALASDTKTVSASITVTPSVVDIFEPYYIPVVSATATAGTASASASQTGMTAGVSSSATSYYFTSSASATGGSASVSAGITKGTSASGTDASDSSTVYLKVSTVSRYTGNTDGNTDTEYGNKIVWTDGYIPAGSTYGVIPVSSAADLTNNLVVANKGIYYKYTGTDTETYTQGNIYTYEG